MIRNIALHIGLVFACSIICLPVFWIIRTSLVAESYVYSQDIFSHFSLNNFLQLINENSFLNNFLNSLIVSLLSVLLTMPFAAATGYAFARFKTGGTFARFIVLSTQMLPAVALVLPAFAALRSIGMTDSLTGLILVYAALNLPFLTWILMGFFEGIPVDLEWAAMTDGATAWQVFIYIVLPISLPGLVAAGVLGFILSWNEFLFALILSGPETSTIPVALAALQTSNGIQMSKVSAGIVLAILPMVIAFHFIQRYIVKGLTFGGVK